MHFLTTLKIFLTSAIITITILGIFMNIKHTEKNIYRRYLLFLLSYWGVVMVTMLSKFTMEGADSLSYNEHIMSVELLLMGIPSFLMLMSYPIVILNANLLKFNYCLRVALPMIVVVALYFGVNSLWGDPFVVFTSYVEIIDNILSVAVISRLLLIFCFITYIVMVVLGILKIIPLYNKYVQDNISDSEYNVDWVRELLKYILCVVCFYFLMILTNSAAVNLLYLASVILMLGYIVDVSLFKHTSEDIKALKINWDKELGWHVKDERDQDEVIAKRDVKHIESLNKRLDIWMVTKSPYTRSDFTIKDIMAEFPDATNYDLSELFKSKGETFQSYVRRYRIRKACEIMNNQEDRIYPKQIYSIVGFSHYSSFSRSFVATMGEAPSEYMKRIR